MFKTLIELFRKEENLIEQAISESTRMIRECKFMFEESVRSLRHADTADLHIDIYEKDKTINKYQREVRRKVITHLTIVGSEQSLTAGLILTSIIIDVERMGDYSKNIVELAQAHPKRLEAGIFEETLVHIESEVTRKFDHAEKSFGDSDVELAQKLMAEHKPLSIECDRMIADIIQEKYKTLSPGEAVVLALYIRFLKRISSHLTNIVSSVANPFPRIGYRENDSRT
ncbi:MAG: hypothetical protein KAT58_09440 [candidate division Zixibacteria bacterium]|nr:hypothetical protein [candidate division Zixibacteria bacterium]